jgi:hypothetical protein
MQGSRIEALHGILSLALSTVRMDRSTRQAFVKKEIIKKVGCFFVIDEHNCPRRRHRQQQIVDTVTLFGFFRENNLCYRQYNMKMYPGTSYVLGDVDMNTSNASNTNTDMVRIHVFLSHHTGFLRESGREHHVNMVCVFVCI